MKGKKTENEWQTMDQWPVKLLNQNILLHTPEELYHKCAIHGHRFSYH